MNHLSHAEDAYSSAEQTSLALVRIRSLLQLMSRLNHGEGSITSEELDTLLATLQSFADEALDNLEPVIGFAMSARSRANAESKPKLGNAPTLQASKRAHDTEVTA